MEFDKSQYFGRYDASNIDQIIDYVKQMDGHLEHTYNFGKPFMKGERETKYIDYLTDRNLNDAPISASESLEYMSSFFQNVPNWNNPGTMINVIPPSNLVSIVSSFFSTLYGSNMAQDTYAGNVIYSEFEVTKYISDLLAWDWKESHGTFTFGGKGTNLYAAKVALSKANPNVAEKGLEGKSYFMLTSQNAHPCHYEVCNWIGIGKENCLEISCGADGKMDVDEAEKVIRREIEAGRVFIGYNLNGGSTNELYVDPIEDIYLLNQRIVKEYRLAYTPHIHVDAVLSWVYLFFNSYDFTANPLSITQSALSKIQSLNYEVQELKYADSVGIDFHKTGFCPYVSSLFIVKNRADFYATNNSTVMKLEDLHYGNYNPYQSTLELTRASLGPVAALASLKSLGVQGFQKILSDMFTATETFRERLASRDDILVINQDAVWLATFFILKPKEFSDLTLEGIHELSEEQIDRIRTYNTDYAKYILQKGEQGDVSFTYTSSRSYKIPGTDISLGVLKAYPMSPFLTAQEVDRIVHEVGESVELYAGGNDNAGYSQRKYISDEMVYREKTKKE